MSHVFVLRHRHVFSAELHRRHRSRCCGLVRRVAIFLKDSRVKNDKIRMISSLKPELMALKMLPPSKIDGESRLENSQKRKNSFSRRKMCFLW